MNVSDKPPTDSRLTRISGPLRVGIATAATVVEGRRSEPGTLSIWDVFAAAPGRVVDGSTPAGGPRHHEFWRADVALLERLGVHSYRFSLPWAVLAQAPAEWDHYTRLVDALRSAGISPMVTLSHYDMPLDVMETGGWLVRDTAEHFAEFAGQAAARWTGLVDHWVTLNSPLVHSAYGYGLGIEAPGLTLLAGALVAGQHQLLGHGLAVAALRAAGAGSVGIANVHTRVDPQSPGDADLAAAGIVDALYNRAFTDPLFGGAWPDVLAELPGAPSADLGHDAAVIAAPLDFYGVNYWHPQSVHADPDNRTIPFGLADAEHLPTDEFGWPTDPPALRETLLALRRRHPGMPPLWVTENGTQDSGGLDDQHRSDYLRTHLAAVDEANAAGADVRGYLHWSLLDGWEFAEGLTRRFGLVAVDPETGERTPKASFSVFRDLISAREQRLHD